MDLSDPLERILQNRYVPSMRTNLPERIITASLMDVKQKSKKSLTWLSEFFDHFVLPSPALAMVAMLILGVFIGLAPNSDNTQEDSPFSQSRIQADLGDML